MQAEREKHSERLSEVVASEVEGLSREDKSRMLLIIREWQQGKMEDDRISQEVIELESKVSVGLEKLGKLYGRENIFEMADKLLAEAVLDEDVVRPFARDFSNKVVEAIDRKPEEVQLSDLIDKWHEMKGLVAEYNGSVTLRTDANRAILMGDLGVMFKYNQFVALTRTPSNEMDQALLRFILDNYPGMDKFKAVDINKLIPFALYGEDQAPSPAAFSRRKQLQNSHIDEDRLLETAT